MNSNILYEFNTSSRPHQHVLHLLRIIKKSTVPEIVETSLVIVEEAAIRSIKLVDSIDCILRGMTVYNIQKDYNTHAVCCINELL